MSTPAEEYLGSSNGAAPSADSIGCEQVVLGGLLLGAPWCDVEILGPTDFLRQDHALIFVTIAYLASTGIAVDPITVSEQLLKTRGLDDAGGLAYLSQLARETASNKNIRAYARILRERSDARATVGAITNVLEDSAGLDSGEILRALEQRLEPVRQRLSWRTARRPSLDWQTLESLPLPAREWIIERWLPAAHPTLFAGAGGTGKTTVLQALGSCAALRREYLDWPGNERRVLMWACEDDVDELHRRQVAIAKWLNVKLSDFADRFTLLSYDREEVELAALIDQRLTETPMLRQLREQIGDYRADLVLLDPISRIYGGNENDRHQVAQFMAMLSRAGNTTRAAIVVVGHPGKAQGSEYSGSTAWEGAVRARLFLGRTLPDAGHDQADEPAEDDGVRYLCRRKANYSARDWRRLTFRDGVMVPDAPIDDGGRRNGSSVNYSRDVVGRAVQKLAAMGQYGVAGKSSQSFLPKLARTYKLLENITERDFTEAMRAMETDGSLVKEVVGQYGNRSKREGLVLAASGSNGGHV